MQHWNLLKLYKQHIISVILFLQTDSIVQEQVPLSNNTNGSLLCSLLTIHVKDMHDKCPREELVCFLQYLH